MPANSPDRVSEVGRSRSSKKKARGDNMRGILRAATEDKKSEYAGLLKSLLDIKHGNTDVFGELLNKALEADANISMLKVMQMHSHSCMKIKNKKENKHVEQSFKPPLSTDSMQAFLKGLQGISLGEEGLTQDKGHAEEEAYRNKKEKRGQADKWENGQTGWHRPQKGGEICTREAGSTACKGLSVRQTAIQSTHSRWIRGHKPY